MKSLFAAAVCGLCLTGTASASQVLVNGGFETGSFSGWTTVSSNGSGGGWFVDSASVSPLNGFPTVGAFSGSDYAVTDGFGPGTNVLYQSFTDPLGATSAILSFDAFVDDDFGGSGFGGEVDLLAGNANPLTGTPIAVFYQADTSGTSNPYAGYSGDISSLMTPGDTYILRAYESDSSGPINFGVDNFSLSVSTSTPAATPEPNLLLLAALAGAFAYRTGRRMIQIQNT